MVKEQGSSEASYGVDDAVSVSRACRGDDEAFDLLYRRHYTKVVSLAIHLDGNREAAEDIAQTAFLRAYRSLSKIRDGQGFLMFVYRTVVNLVRDRARAARRRSWIGLADLLHNASGAEIEVLSADASPESRVIADTFASEIIEGIGNLPLEFREAVVLHHLHGLDVQTVAQTLGVPEGTVKSRLSRGRQRLREEYGSWLD